MIRNYFYLIVGLLCVLFAVTHTLNGVETTLPVLNKAEIASDAKVAFTYVWHIIGVENFIFGIALLLMAFSKNMMKTKFVPRLIMIILAMRWVVITHFTLSNNGDIKQLIPDTVAIFIVIILLFLGTKVKGKNTDE